jgi:anaerobic selenocysteine-containing dehydrogenase
MATMPSECSAGEPDDGEDVLMGKFARMCLKTAHIDYNGRLCMVSAAAGSKLAFGIDRSANAWEDIIGTDVVWISGSNVAECSPITTDYVWQAREHGPRSSSSIPASRPSRRRATSTCPSSRAATRTLQRRAPPDDRE